MTLLIRNLKKRYGDKIALNEFTMEFEEGIYGILGANGAGKSTLMNLITDNVKRDSGSIFYNGREVLEQGASYRAQIGYMPQHDGMYDQMSARGFLHYMAEIKGIRKKDARVQVEELLRVVNLEKDAHRKIGGFSGGMRRRVLLAQALLGNPKILILDEPTAGLDPKERITLRNYIEKLSEEKIILLATHIVSDIEAIADLVLIMKNGELIKKGNPEELIDELNKIGVTPIYHQIGLEDVYLHFVEGDSDERS